MPYLEDPISEKPTTNFLDANSAGKKLAKKPFDEIFKKDYAEPDSKRKGSIESSQKNIGDVFLLSDDDGRISMGAKESGPKSNALDESDVLEAVCYLDGKKIVDSKISDGGLGDS